MIPEEDYHMGWVIQPIRGDLFYLYERKDTDGSNGSFFKGTRRGAFQYIYTLVGLG